jgi:hypothetical protein
MTNFSTANPGGDSNVERDRWGRPMLALPGKSKKAAFTRVTTLAKTLESTDALTAWKQRMTAIGLTQRPDLLALVSAMPDDKNKVDSVCRDAVEAAQASAKANVGTAVHAFCDHADRGTLVGSQVPADIKPLLADYLTMQTTHGVVVVDIERFVANPVHMYAGTADRIIEVGGKRYIGDIKTGRIDYAAQSIAMQLACYARSAIYDVATDTWGEPLDVSRDWAYVFHLPYGGGEPGIHRVDIAMGWEAVERALWVRDWRKSKPMTQVVGK